MTRGQRFLLRFVPKSRRADAERESREWMMTCPCGETTSIWDMGGIRYGAKSRGKTTTGRCATCATKFTAEVTRRVE